MKKLVSLFLFFMLLNNSLLLASECYHYHTKKHYKIRSLAGKNYLELYTKDPDQITYVSRERYLIANLNGPLKIVADDALHMLVRDNQFYYLVSKEIPYEQPLTAKKLFAINSGIKMKNTRLIRFAGKWRYIVPNNDVKRGFDELILDKLPGDFEILYTFNRDRGANYLIKAAKTVATINISIEYQNNTYTYNAIPKLDPLTTVFTAANEQLDDGFLRDNRHFYLINYDLNLTEVTDQFIKEKKTGFHKMNISWNSFYTPVFSDAGKILWIYLKEGIGLADGSNPNFYPINAKFLNKDSVIIVYNGKYYSNGWAAAFQVENIDLTKVRDKASLVSLDDNQFADRYQHYNLDNYRLVPGATLSAPGSVQKLPAINAYGARTDALELSSGFLVPENSKQKIRCKSAVKSLIKAYAFDDQLMIENQLIKNPGNRDKMVFVGALADVIQPCDGGRGQYPVVVEYNYFFKDDHAVYAYHSKQKAIQILKDFKPNEIRVDNFDDLQKMVKKVAKNVVKKH